MIPLNGGGAGGDDGGGCMLVARAGEGPEADAAAPAPGDSVDPTPLLPPAVLAAIDREAAGTAMVLVEQRSSAGRSGPAPAPEPALPPALPPAPAPLAFMGRSHAFWVD